MTEREKPSDWRLERLAHGEVDEPSTERVQERLAALESSNREILDRLPPAVVGASIRRRLQPRPHRARWLALALPLAVAAAVWVIVVRPVDDGERVKGATHIHVYRQGDKPQRLASGSRVRPHDAVQLTYTAGRARYGAVVSLDGRGVVTQHLPVTDDAAAALSSAGEIKLPRSYELDDAPAFERFFFVTSDRPFSVTQAVAAAHALAGQDDARRRPLLLAPELSQESLLLEKVNP